MHPSSPVVELQEWLLEEGRCVSCGNELAFAQKERKNGTFLLTCVCRRVFVWDPAKDLYRRAYLEDVQY